MPKPLPQNPRLPAVTDHLMAVSCYRTKMFPCFHSFTKFLFIIISMIPKNYFFGNNKAQKKENPDRFSARALTNSIYFTVIRTSLSKLIPIITCLFWKHISCQCYIHCTCNGKWSTGYLPCTFTNTIFIVYIRLYTIFIW